MKLISLKDSTDVQEVDEILQGIVGIYEMVFPNRIRGHYVIGSYGNRTAIPLSDLDMVVFFKGNFMDEEERNADQVYRHCKSISPVHLDIKLYDEETLLRADTNLAPLDYYVAKIACHRVATKMGSLFIYGTDTRDQIPTPPIDMYMRGWLHNIRCVRIRAECGYTNTVTVPLDYPDLKGEFYGYVHQGQTNLHGLVLHVSLLATMLITLKGERYVGHKSACPLLYKECVGDEWTPFIEEVFGICRNQWKQRVPKNPKDRKRLREICSRVLPFENHCMRVLKDYLITQLQSDNFANRLSAAYWLGEIVYLDDEVLLALQAVESHGNEALRSTVKETMEGIQTVLEKVEGGGTEMNAIEKLKPHDIILHDENVILRPLTEDDWEYLVKWEGNPEVTYWFGGFFFKDGSEAYLLREVQEHFRLGSQNAYIWIIEFKKKPIGYCTLALGAVDDEIFAEFAERDCRNIEIVIGEKKFWGQGIGTKAIHLVTQFAFERDNAEVLCVIDVSDFNVRARRVFEKNGFEVYTTRRMPPGERERDLYYLVLTHEQYEKIPETPNDIISSLLVSHS